MSKAILVAMVLTVWLVAFAPVVWAQQHDTPPVDLGAPGCDGNHGFDCAVELEMEAEAAGFAQYRDTTPSDPNRPVIITQDDYIHPGPYPDSINPGGYPDSYGAPVPNGNIIQDDGLYPGPYPGPY